MQYLSTATNIPLASTLMMSGIKPACSRYYEFGPCTRRFTASAGNAIGRYADGFFPDGIVGGNRQIHLAKQWGWFAAYRHYWSDQLRSNLVLSTAGENNPAGAPANTNKSTRSAHVNLIWSPVANSDLGVEYIHADRETEDGLKGSLNRFQASAKYAFQIESVEEASARSIRERQIAVPCIRSS